MQTLARNGFTEQEVLDALRGKHGRRRISFRYDHLDANNGYLGQLTNVLKCSISQSYFADIKRTAKFTLADTGEINYLRDRIRPWVRLYMPPLKASEPSTYSEVLEAIPGDQLLRYKLDEAPGATTAINSAPTGSVYNGALLTSAQAKSPGAPGLIDEGSGYTFTGLVDTDCAIRAANASTAINTKSQLTLSFWFKATTASRDEVMIDTTEADSTGGMRIMKTSANKLKVLLSLTTGMIIAETASAAFSANTVFNVVMTWRSGVGLRLWVNGTEQMLNSTGISLASVGVTNNVTPVFYIGKWRSGTLGFDGTIDDVTFIETYIEDPLVPVNLYLSGSKQGRFGGNNYVEWPQGVFLLTSPSRTSDESRTVSREVDAYDSLQVLSDDVVTDRFTYAAGSLYTDNVSALLGSMDKNITPSSKTLPVAMEWEPGTSKLTICNALLAAINYEALFFDELGTAIARPYAAPADRAVEFVYRDDEDSVTLPDVDQTIDLFSVPNKWVLVVSDADRVALRSEYINDDPTSLTSTVSRGRTIVDFRTEQDAADQATLDGKVARLAAEASQVFEEIDFETALMPIHSHNDVYTFAFSNLVIDDKYSETGWEMELSAGASMKHTIRKVVYVA